jgi:hypothetical protein
MGEFVRTPGAWTLDTLKDAGDTIAIDYGQGWAVRGMRGAIEEAQAEARGLSGNPFRVAGYLRETPEEAGYRVIKSKGKELILEDKSNGKRELWMKSPNFAGAAIYHKGSTYEFASSSIQSNRMRSHRTHGLSLKQMMKLYRMVSRGNPRAVKFAKSVLGIPASESLSQVKAVVYHHVLDLKGKI